MNTMKNRATILASVAFSCVSTCFGASVDTLRINNILIERRANTGIAAIDGKTICIIKDLDAFYWLDTPVRMTTDRQAVIFSPTQYILLTDVATCGRGSMSPRAIPKSKGALIDINAKDKIYLSVDRVSSTPPLYLATFGHLDGSTPVYFPKGTWTNSSKTNNRTSFDGVDGSNPKGKISPDGRYITATDVPDCSTSAYPGVWDLKEKRRVILTDDERSLSSDKCLRLFSAH